MFKKASGDLMNLPVSDKTIAVEWAGEGRILASYAMRGRALSAHFASDKKGLRNLKKAIDDFCSWAFNKYEWCTMILAVIKKKSVVRLVKKCGFMPVGYNKDVTVYARVK